MKGKTTVVEWLVVIAIIGVFASLILPAIQAIWKANDPVVIKARQEEQATLLETKSRFKHLNNGQFPDDSPLSGIAYSIFRDTKTGDKFIFIRNGVSISFSKLEEGESNE